MNIDFNEILMVIGIVFIIGLIIIIPLIIFS